MRQRHQMVIVWEPKGDLVEFLVKLDGRTVITGLHGDTRGMVAFVSSTLTHIEDREGGDKPKDGAA